MQAHLASLVVAAVFSADAAVVRQVFEPEVPTVGVWRPEQPIDAAAWIWADGLPDVRPVFVRFTCPFEAADGVLRLHVSADERFALYLDDAGAEAATFFLPSAPGYKECSRSADAKLS